MTLYRKLLDPRFLSADDLDGKEITLTIDKVVDQLTAKELKLELHDQRTQGVVIKPILIFRERKQNGDETRLVLNTTNIKKLAMILGKHYEEWAGKRVTLYPTAVKGFGTTVDGIRIKEAKQ